MSVQESIERSPSISTAEMDFQRGNPQFFGDLAALLWRDRKPDYELHLRTGESERMCRNWIAGSNPPNARAVRAVLGEILLRLKLS